MITYRRVPPVFALVVLLIVSARATLAGPTAPTLSSPSPGATLPEPFTIAWSSVSDPHGIIAYNWQVSPSSSFSTVVLQDSTNGATQDIVSGLADGAYYWRVQAVNGAFEQGAWSQARTFTVSGTGAGAPSPPTLAPPQAYATFHPYEVMTFTWSGVAGAASYLLQASTDPSFPVSTAIQFDNIPNTTHSFAIANPEGNYFARVLAVDANGVRSQPSNVISFSVFYNNPIGPPPSSVSPSGGTTLSLPITFVWTDVPNPQPSGYELQIATDSRFRKLEFLYNQITDPTYTLTSLTPGTKFWRVRSAQGAASPTTAAETAWSEVKSFQVTTAAATPVSVSFTTDPLASGNTTWVQVQLTAAVSSSGATIALTSSDTRAAPVPPSITVPGNVGWVQFQMQAGQVTTPTPVTITATLNSKSASGQLTVAPASVKSLSISPSTITGGGAQPWGIVMLTGQAPPGGATVTLSSNSPAVTPPPSVFVNAGDFSVSFPIPTSAVTANTTATVHATWDGTTVQSQVTLTPQQQPASLTLSPTSTVGQGGGSFGTVTIASAQSSDLMLQVTSSNPNVASVPPAVMIPAGSTTGGFNVFTSAVTTNTVVTISVSGGGVTRSASLTVTPTAAPPAPATSSIAITPSTVVGGNGSQGTVTLASVAPTGGASVQLTSSSVEVVTVPATMTVPAGATTASFAIGTSAVTVSTGVTIAATSGGVTRSGTLTVVPPTQPATLTVTASGRSGERVMSNPAGISVAVGSTGSATFAGGTVITLSVSNTRDAIWSGACSSGGNKQKTCAFTLTGNASVTVNVQ
jgi:hypothetical protein